MLFQNNSNGLQWSKHLWAYKISFCLPIALRCSPLEISSKKISQHLTNWMRKNNTDDIWNSTNSLCKRYICFHQHCGCLNSLILVMNIEEVKVWGGGTNFYNCHRLTEIEKMLESIYLEFFILGCKVMSPHKEHR